MNKITEEQKQKAVEAFEQDGNMIKAAKAAGVCVRTLQREKNRCKIFRKALEEADAVYHEYLKQQIRDATQNPDIKMPQLYAIMFEAKKHMPEYRETFEHKVDADIRVITGVPRPSDKSQPEESKPKGKSKSKTKLTTKAIVEKAQYVGQRITE